MRGAATFGLERVLHELRTMPGGSVVSLVAPGGYGKSTLARALLDEGPGWHLALRAAHGDVAELLVDLGHAVGLDRAVPDGALLAQVTRRLDAAAAWLVLDDVHLVHGRSALDLIGDLAAQLRNGRLLLASRERPAIGLDVLRAQGRLRELDERDLRLDEDAAVALAERVSGGPLDPSGEALVRRASGWPAGIIILGFSLSRHSRWDGAAVAVTAGADLHELVEDLVLADLDDDLRAFVVELGAIGVFDDDVAIAATERANAPELLEQLRSRRLFVEPARSPPGAWRFHDVFQAALAPSTSHLGAERTTELRRRAALDWARRGQTGVVVERLLDYDDPRLAVSVVVEISRGPDSAILGEVDRAWSDGRIVAMDRLLSRWDLADDDIEVQPLAVMFILAVMAGEVARAGAVRALLWPQLTRFSRITALLTLLDANYQLQAGDHAAAASAVGTVRERVAHAEGRAPRQLRYLIASIDAQLALATGDPAAADAAARRALDAPAERSWLAESRLRAIRGAAALVMGDVRAADGHLEAAEAVLRRQRLDDAIQVPPELAWLRITRLAGPDPAAARAAGLAAIHDPAFKIRAAADVLPIVALATVERELGLHLEADAHLLRARSRLTGVTGAPWLEELVERAARGEVAPVAGAPVRSLAELTDRERAVLRLLRSRLTLTEIARELDVSVNTVKTHARGLYRKLGVSSRAEAVSALARS